MGFRSVVKFTCISPSHVSDRIEPRTTINFRGQGWLALICIRE